MSDSYDRSSVLGLEVEIERLHAQLDEWRKAAEAWFPIPEDMTDLSRAIGGAIGKQDVTISRMLALRLYQSLEASRRAVGVWKGEAARINAALTEDIDRLGRERDDLARECRHALLAAMGYIGGVSVLDRSGIERTIREALSHPAIRAAGRDPALDDLTTPPGPPDPPRPKCGRCRCPYALHDPITGECSRCDCSRYLFPEVA